VTLPILPTFAGLDFPVSKSPITSTRVLTAASGKEYRNKNWSYNRWKFSLPIEFLRTYGSFREFQTLVSFILSQSGMYGNWLFSDPTDNTVTDQVIAVADGTTRSFSLLRTIGSTFNYDEPILAVNTISSVKVSGTLTTDYTLSSTNGYANDTIVFNSTPSASAPIEVSFSFYFVCRFLQDDLEFQNFTGGRWNVKKLDFESVK
jgi:uncharacterized protein (TIGR02217 family)